MEITLKSLGLSKEQVTERVIAVLVDRLMESVFYDEDGNGVEKESKFSIQIYDRVKKAVDGKIDALFKEHVAPNVSRYVEELTLVETNKWGEKKGTKVTFIEHLIQRAEAYITEKVDFNGKSQAEAGGYSWSGTQTRITYLVHQHLHYAIENAMKQAIADANKNIVGGLEAAVKIKLGEISQKLKVEVHTGR